MTVRPWGSTAKPLLAPTTPVLASSGGTCPGFPLAGRCPHFDSPAPGLAVTCRLHPLRERDFGNSRSRARTAPVRAPKLAAPQAPEHAYQFHAEGTTPKCESASVSLPTHFRERSFLARSSHLTTTAPKATLRRTLFRVRSCIVESGVLHRKVQLCLVFLRVLLLVGANQ